MRRVNVDLSLNKIVLTRHLLNQRTSGPVNDHLISWPSKAQNKQNQESFHKKLGSDQQSSS